MHHIDLGSVLRETISCDLYSNLVTRPTGAAVRSQIERLLQADVRALTVIDLTHVSMIDFSCADEIIAKLMLRYCEESAPRDVYFLFRGVTDDHWDAIGSVVERHGLALVIENEGGIQLAGVVEEADRTLWEAVRLHGTTSAAFLAEQLGVDEASVETQLDALWRRRLLVKLGTRYAAVGDARG